MFVSKLSIASLAVALFIAFMLSLTIVAPTKKVEYQATYSTLIKFFIQAQQVPQSQRLGDAIGKIVEKRINCYKESPFARIPRCMGSYLNELLDLGRQNVQSAPDLAAFMDDMPLCPTTFAMCMGEWNDPDHCRTIEARCVDGVFDRSWRGRPFDRRNLPNKLQQRVEKVLPVLFQHAGIQSADSNKPHLVAELLQAAFSCGHSLQKSLSLPGIAALCAELAESLTARAWKPGQYTRFAVQEPKLREIFAPAFGDRVVEAWLVDLVEEPLSRLFIDDTFANKIYPQPLLSG